MAGQQEWKAKYSTRPMSRVVPRKREHVTGQTEAHQGASDHSLKKREIQIILLTAQID